MVSLHTLSRVGDPLREVDALGRDERSKKG